MTTDPNTGLWEPDETTVEGRLPGLLSQKNPLMKQAETFGLQQANKRGLLNSSMAVGAAQDATLRTALPIASQDASQAHQTKQQEAQFGHQTQLQESQFGHETGMQQRDITSKENIAFANIAAHDRDRAASMATAMENAYAEMFRTIAQQHELPANVRDQYLNHLGTIRDNNMRLVEQMWGVQLQWQTPGI